MPRGRQAIEVNKDLLIKCVTDIENKHKLVNRQELYKAAANLYGEKSSSISPSTVYNRLAEWKVELKTPKGKRGNNAPPVGPKGSRTSREEKTGKFKENFDLMRAEVIDHGKETLLPLIDKIEKGSMAARVKFNCIRCCGYDRSEVPRCTSYACPWFSVRPNALTKEEQNND